MLDGMKPEDLAVGSLGATGVVMLISKAFQFMRRDDAATVGIRSDAQRIKDMQEALSAKSIECEKKEQIIAMLNNEKTTLHIELADLKKDLSIAMHKIDHLTKMVTVLMQQNGGTIPPELLMEGLTNPPTKVGHDAAGLMPSNNPSTTVITELDKLIRERGEQACEFIKDNYK